VIVPFFWRQVYTSDENFPRVIAIPGQDRAIVAFSKADLPPDVKGALKQAHLFEWERILYVALTRSRHTLVLATDQPLFAKQGGLAHTDSLIKWFRADGGGINEKRMAGLPLAPSVCAQTHDFQIARQPSESALAQIEIAPGVASPTDARTHAAEFPRRSIPSSFTPDTAVVESTGVDKQSETEPEFRATTVPSPATRYGIWWHEFLQQVPRFHQKPFDLETADKTFSASLPSSPDSARSTREWKLLREYLSGRDGIVFNGDETIARSEMPFLWAANEHRSVEGVIDLALIEPDQRKLLVLDWKTNDVKPEQLDKLRAHYLPQLAAYWKAIGEITKFEISAAIYSTAAGTLVRYDPGELENEWSRLKKLPPDDFGGQAPEPIAQARAETRQQLELF
jgi:ATP-dependent exoDNAse (exonuclease V) beta subunit